MQVRRSFIGSSLLAAFCFAPLATHAEQYVLDDQHTSVVFAIDHFSLSYCYGMFGKYSGKIDFEPANPTTLKLDFTIDAASLDTKSAKRDEHLRGPDFFNVKQFPSIKFVSKKVTLDGETMNIMGDMTLHGVTKEITLPLKFRGTGTVPDGSTHIGFFGDTVLHRSDFGISTYLPKIGDDVTLMISFEGIKQ